MGNGVALHVAAADLAQGIDFGLGLCAFRHNRDVEVLREIDKENEKNLADLPRW